MIAQYLINKDFLLVFYSLIPFLIILYLLYKKLKKTKLRLISEYLLYVIFFFLFIAFIEPNIKMNLDYTDFVFFYYAEIILIMLLFHLMLFTVMNPHYNQYFSYAYYSMISIMFHLFIATFLDLVLSLVVLVGILLPFGSIFFIYDKIKKIFMLLFSFSYFSYIWIFLDIFQIGIFSYILAIPFFSVGNREIRARFRSIYFRFRANIWSLFHVSKSKNNNKRSIDKNYKKGRSNLFYLARVELTHIFCEKNEEYKFEDRRLIDGEKEWVRTFLMDYLDNKSTYGLEISSENNLKISIFTQAKTYKSALQKGRTILSTLKHLYPGINGTEKKPIIVTKNLLFNKRRFYEIKLPKPPYIKKVTLLHDILDLYYNTDQKFHIYIQWKRTKKRAIARIKAKIAKLKFTDAEEKSKFRAMWQDNAFKIKVYVSYNIKTKGSKLKNLKKIEMKGDLKSLISSGKSEMKGIRIRRASSASMANIITGNLFGAKCITPMVLDFDLPEYLPLKKSQHLKTENISFKNVNPENKDYIKIGNYVNRFGVLTKKIKCIPIQALAKGVIISGQPGAGKTMFQAHIEHQLYEKRKDIGALIFNFAKENQASLYKYDHYIKYGQKNFHVPYFLPNKNIKQVIQEYARILIGTIGLKNVVEKIMKIILHEYLKQKGRVDSNIRFIYKNVLKYIREHPYKGEFQTNIQRALENRINTLFQDKVLIRTLDPTYGVPWWFREITNGKKVFLDLSECSLDEKRLLACLVFQIFRVVLPKVDQGGLKILIMIDESHQIAANAEGLDHDDDEFIACMALFKILDPLILEFRSQGLSMLFSCKDLSSLNQSVVRNPSLKICFRVGPPNNEFYLIDQDEQELLRDLEDRKVLVLDGSTGEKYLIKTPDFAISQFIMENGTINN